MKKTLSKIEIISLLKAEKQLLKKEFGVINIGLFGSYAKDLQDVDSDIDFLVELSEPRFELLVSLQRYMEKKFDRKIEIIRKHNLISNRFLKNLEQEIIYA